ncbi:MAG: hypothetical protein HKN11_07600, partial [Rhizobiales bacterium]|nr:hypothetical protein [Hyphomicrobiales bacterium]
MQLSRRFFFKRYAYAVLVMIVATTIAVLMCLSQLSYVDRTKQIAEQLTDLSHAAQTASSILHG